MTLRTMIGLAYFCDKACSFEILINLETITCIKLTFSWGKKETMAFI